MRLCIFAQKLMACRTTVYQNHNRCFTWFDDISFRLMPSCTAVTSKYNILNINLALKTVLLLLYHTQQKIFLILKQLHLFSLQYWNHLQVIGMHEKPRITLDCMISLRDSLPIGSGLVLSGSRRQFLLRFILLNFVS